MTHFVRRCLEAVLDPGTAAVLPAHPKHGELPLHLELARDYAELIRLPDDPESERTLHEIDRLFDEVLKIAT